jgi:serine/threonine-protein kinase Chk2
LVGYPPFSEDRSDLDLPKQITGGHYTHYFKTSEWNTVSQNGDCLPVQVIFHNLLFLAAKDLVQALLTTEPKDRLTLKDALEHPWFQVCLLFPLD